MSDPNIMRHEYKPLSNDAYESITKVKNLASALHQHLETLGASRELSLAKTKVEEAVMWATKHITA